MVDYAYSSVMMRFRPFLLICSATFACREQSKNESATETTTCATTAETSVNWDGAVLSVAADGCGSATLTPRVLGSGSWTVDFDTTDGGGWQPVLTAEEGGIFEGLVLEGTWALEGEADPVLWRQGYQSWSWSGVTEPGTANRDGDDVFEVGGDGDASEVILENDSTSWWVGLVARGDGGGLLLGAQSAQKTRFFMGMDSGNVQAVWGHRGEAITVQTGASLSLDPLWVGMGSDAWALHGDYADAVSERIEPRPISARPPIGWATWYQYYSEVTEDDVRENLDELVDLQTSGSLSEVTLLQIDDGWQERWGQWWAGSQFPSGMESLATDITAAGMTPGLWMAPFYVSIHSETYTDNPDWWVSDESGDPITYEHMGGDTYAVIDPTHPEAAEWLRDLISGIVDQGWTYLKLDFLYAGAQQGVRTEDVTGVEAFHRGMEIMRDAAGDAWILACGAPMLPSVGYAESFRSGADIAFEISPDPMVDYYRWQARASAGRSWSHGKWWWIDPDQLIVRDPLTDTEVRGAIVSVTVAGGTWLLGDDLAALPEDRLALSLNPAITDLLGQQVEPQSPLDFLSGIDASPVVEQVQQNDRVPTHWTFDDGTIALLNLGTDAVTVTGPGGTNLLTGETASEGDRTLEAGDGELWRP